MITRAGIMSGYWKPNIFTSEWMNSYMKAIAKQSEKNIAKHQYLKNK